MAVLLLPPAARYVGLATDDKPTDAAPGSTFTERDTGALFYWSGVEWVRGDVSPAAQPGAVAPALSPRVQRQILSELRRISPLLATAQGISPMAFDPVPEPDGI